jgi:biotin carboxylase
MRELEGKKLLILGGGATSIDIVKAAQALGVYVIVTDYYDVNRSPAKLIANECWNESITDYDKLCALIKEKSVNGIITGFTDSYLMPYQHLCELSGLPCYATKEVFELTMDKARFKQLCRDNDVPVIPEYDLASFDPSIINDKHKVIVKPVDNSGSRGVILCTKPEDFQKCLDYALSFSEKKQVVMERYMEMDSISISYTIQDGVVSLSTTDDRYVHKAASGSSVTQCGIYPSKYTEAYIQKIDGKMKRMYERAGLRNGVLAVQFFTDGNDFYVMEMGHRLTGGQHYTYTMAENGISSLDQLIQFAVTGRMADFSIAERDNACFKHVYCHLFILGKEAKIARFEGMDYLKRMPEIMHITEMKKVGDKIGVDGTSAQKVVGLHMKVDDFAHLKRVLEDIKQHFHFYDEAGNDLTIMFNKDRI